MTQWGNDKPDNTDNGGPENSDPWSAPPPAQPEYGQSTPPADPWSSPPPATNAPQYGQPDPYSAPPGQPQYGQPQYGQPQYGQPQPGQPQYGQPQPGQSSYPAAPGYSSFGPMPGAAMPGQYGQYGQAGGANVVEPARPFKRLLARILDVILMAIVGGILYGLGVGHDAFHSVTRFDGTTQVVVDQGKLAALILVTGLAIFVYEWLFIAFKGQTLGKMAAGVKVVRADTGQPLGLGKAFLRWAVPGVPGLIPRIGGLLTLIVWLSIFFDKTKRYQGWHDKAAGDFVIKSR